ncbi:MAG: Uncharacterized protein Rv0487/MT0505 clustered with mycothiol biosynthesis gene, partial [uncultured Nocardioides sp.]
ERCDRARLPRRRGDRVLRACAGHVLPEPARRAQAADGRAARRRPARARRARLRVPQPRREPRPRLQVAARAQPEDVRRGVRRRPPRRHLPRRPAPALDGQRRGARPAPRVRAEPGRRVVQRHPGARLRVLDPQGVGVAALPRGVDGEPGCLHRPAPLRRRRGRRGGRTGRPV